MGDRTCSIDDCEKPARGRGWCGMHWWRWRNHGTTESPRLPIEDRFWSKVDRTGGGEACQHWLGLKDKDGYGVFAVARGDNQRAHRWILGRVRNSPLGRGELACHTCDNPACVNPQHLYVGTPYENMQDKIDRGRARNGFGAWTRTHCMRGHEFTAGNTYICRRGKRQCRTCQRMRDQKSRNAVRG